ncbi:hypothetical protein BDA96_05G247300 [Sorghum bicolor]|uniref:Uncharacterized protein n=1 Tax=Sorghum bicolor TaxID=4558 RepID=A0A921R264_SORBI|nr:hypothetical protein BDA96_05G247300 [Sorghum bicolor]
MEKDRHDDTARLMIRAFAMGGKKGVKRNKQNLTTGRKYCAHRQRLLPGSSLTFGSHLASGLILRARCITSSVCSLGPRSDHQIMRTP